MTTLQKTLAATVGAAALIGVLALIAPYYTTQIFWELRSMSVVLVPIIVICVLGVLAALLTSDRDTFPAGVVAWVFTAAAVIGTGVLWFGYPYIQGKEYAASVTITDDDMPEMNVRTPLSAAQEQSRTTLSNIPGADLILDSTMYQPSTSEYTTLATGRSWLGNYSAVAVQKFPLTGRSEGSQCEFSDNASRSLSGWFHHNLGRTINSTKRGVNWSASDAYGLCKDGVPQVIVPLKKQVGWLVVTEVPAGVAIYDGDTGKVSVHDTVPEWVTGPSYPLSLAEKQRASTAATGSWMQYLRSQIGWKPAEGADVAQNEEGADVAQNVSEFVLGTKEDNTAGYVTLLSLEGTSTGINAVSVVPAQAGEAGKLNPITIYKLNPTWNSRDAIISRIEADYRDIPNWQNLAVQEIAPISSNFWVASIGNDRFTQYRVKGTGDFGQFPGIHVPGYKEGDDESSIATCLFKESATVSVQCGSMALRDGRGVGLQYGVREGVAPVPATTAPPAEGVPSRDPRASLSQMSDKELADLLGGIADELRARHGRG